MPARRKSNDADARRIDMPLRRMLAREAHRLLRILKVRAVLRIMAHLRHAILHQQARHINRVQPVADIQPLFLPR
jgi:hypothetical protein